MLKKIIGLGIALIILTACGGESSTTSSNDTANNPNNGDSSSTLIEGGTINAPTSLQFEKVYNVPLSHKTYVKINAQQFRRLTFDLVADGTINAEINILDKNGNKALLFAYGDTRSDINYGKGTDDIIFLKAAEYILEFSIVYRYNSTKCHLVVHDLGVATLEKIENKKTYHGGERKYYRFEMTKDGEININGSSNTMATIYDYDLNVVENLSDVDDINVTLAKGSYLLNVKNDSNFVVTFY